MKSKKLQRIYRKGRTKMLGGKRDAEKLRVDAANLRREHDLCLCGDEEVFYESLEAEATDKDRPMVICEACNKRKLRVVLKIKGDQQPTPKTQAALDKVNSLGLIEGLLK